MAEIREYLRQVIESKSVTAFHQLVLHYESRVFTLCVRIIKNREDAEEAAQDVFLRCYGRIHQLEDLGKFPQWLMKIAYFIAIDYVRKKKDKSLPLDLIPHLSAGEHGSSHNGNLKDSDKLEKALKSLDSTDVAIINLYYQEDYSVREIAALMDMTESNVKVRLYRSRQKIREQLEAQTSIRPIQKPNR